MTGFFGVRVDVEDWREVERDADRPELGGQGTANRSASTSSPLRPSAAIGGHSVNGAFEPRDPTALLVHADPGGYILCEPGRVMTELGHLLRLLDVAVPANRITPPRPNSRASARSLGRNPVPPNPAMSSCPI